MEMIFGVVILFYLLIALSLSIKYFTLLSREQNISPEEKTICIITFSIATIFWPIAMPISYLELFGSQTSIKKTFASVSE